MSVHESTVLGDRKLWLIDTPGFDDTFHSGEDVLQQIALAFAKLYEEGARMTGMIYLHRISDPRMSGSAILNLDVFKSICGASAMPIVRIVSTRWCDIGDKSLAFEAAQGRQEELESTDRFWGSMIKDGAVPIRHTGTVQSGLSILRSLLHNEVGPRPALALQKELVKYNLPLSETAAGKLVVEQRRKIEAQYRKKLQELTTERDEYLAAKDREASEELAKEIEKEKQQLEALKARSAMNSLQMDFKQMNADMLNRVSTSSVKERNDLADNEREDMRARIDFLSRQMIELEHEMDSKQRAHNRQLARLQAQSRGRAAQEDNSMATQAAQLVTAYNQGCKNTAMKLREYEREQRELLQRRPRRADTIPFVIKWAHKIF